MKQVSMSLVDFLATDVGSKLWDSVEVRLVLNQETVVILECNYDVIKDSISLFNMATNEFTTQVDNYKVIGYTTIDEVNYIFIERTI